MLPVSLHETVYLTRIFGYLLACLVLTQLGADSLYLVGWLVFLVVYPHVLQWFVERSGSDHYAVELSMLVDAVIVGLLISLTGFNLEASVVLTTLLSISTLIVGGIGLLLSTSPLIVSGMIAGTRYHPEAFTGGSGFYFTSFAILLAYIVFVGALVYRETRRLNLEKRKEQGLRQSLESSRYQWASFIPAQLLERKVPAGRYRRQLTVLFCGVDGINGTMETADERVIAGLLDRFVTTMTGVAERYGGTVSSLGADGLMVFFGDPVSRGARSDALACAKMALDMQSAFDEIALRWQRDTGYPLPRLRIGLHAGCCLVGEFGSGDRREYTALGRTVQLAARLQGAAEGGEVLVSQQALNLLREHVQVGPRGAVFLDNQQVESFSIKNLA